MLKEYAHRCAREIIEDAKAAARDAGACAIVITVQFDCDNTWEGNTGGFAESNEASENAFLCLAEAEEQIPILPLKADEPKGSGQ